MKILVTGANGQLGSELKLLAKNIAAHEFQFVDVDEMDLTNEKSIQNFFSDKHFNFIINCAAYTAVDKAETEDKIASAINAEAVKIIAGICKKKNIRLIHISTDYVFDGNGNDPIPVDAVPNPLSVYGRTKLDGEKYALSILNNAYVIRTAWVYSVFGKNFVKTIATLAKTREELKVVADQIGTPTCARDLAGAILNLVDGICFRNTDIPGIYHYSNEGVISWYDFAHFIVQHYKLPCKVTPITTQEYKTLAVRPKFSVLDKRKIKENFGLTIPHWHNSLTICLNELKL